MDIIKNLSLKKSFLVILFSCLLCGSVLAVMSNIICGNIHAELMSEYITEKGETGNSFDKGENIISPEQNPTSEKTKMPFSISLVGILQTLLPIAFLLISVLVADVLYYKTKLKKPLEVLQGGANCIINNDLDFTFGEHSKDELGLLCDSFEVMRKSLLESHKELWRQAEERRRLNAAFAHELRNPVAVIKNTSKLLPKNGEAAELAALLSEYSDRIENYIATMSTAQTLEETSFKPCEMLYLDFYKKACATINNLQLGKKVNIQNLSLDNKTVLVDTALISHILENIMTNADRFSKDKIEVSVSIKGEYLSIVIADDGVGFQKDNFEIKPFFKSEDNKDDDYHFGMGLYICDLFAKKHGGNITISNDNGAKVKVRIKIS